MGVPSIVVWATWAHGTPFLSLLTSQKREFRRSQVFFNIYLRGRRWLAVIVLLSCHVNSSVNAYDDVYDRMRGSSPVVPGHEKTPGHG